MSEPYVVSQMEAVAEELVQAELELRKYETAPKYAMVMLLPFVPIPPLLLGSSMVVIFANVAGFFPAYADPIAQFFVFSAACTLLFWYVFGMFIVAVIIGANKWQLERKQKVQARVDEQRDILAELQGHLMASHPVGEGGVDDRTVLTGQFERAVEEHARAELRLRWAEQISLAARAVVVWVMTVALFLLSFNLMFSIGRLSADISFEAPGVVRNAAPVVDCLVFLLLAGLAVEYGVMRYLRRGVVRWGAGMVVLRARLGVLG